MANIFQQYGIKEVSDVTFYEIKSDGTPGAPKLYLDTLKVSNLEITSEETKATGGKGNADLVAWSYGKTGTLNCTDALFSMASWEMMFGGKRQDAEEIEVKAIAYVVYDSVITEVVIDGVDRIDDLDGFIFYDDDWDNEVTPSTTGWYAVSWESNGVVSSVIAGGFVEHDGTSLKNVTLDGRNIPAGGTTKYYAVTGGDNITPTTEGIYGVSWVVNTNEEEITVLDIDAETFPGTYYVTADTVARNRTTGADEMLQIILPKAKMSSEASITMEAEGDPSTFDMVLTLLRGEDGSLVKMIKYTTA